MAAWVCAAGSTLLIPSGPEGNHLYIILNDPCVFKGGVYEECIMVGISTIRKAPYDNTCVLTPGCHDFVKEESYVAYKHARVDWASHIEEMVRVNTFMSNVPIENDVLQLIIDGLRRSKQTVRFIKKLKWAK